MLDSSRFTTTPRLIPVLALIATIALLTPPVTAELANPVEMNQVAENWLTQVTTARGNWAGAQSPTVLGENELRAGDTLLARYYDISPRGFVLVPVLKEMTPVKVYSDESNLDDAQMEGFLAMMTELLSERIRLFAETFGSLEASQPAAGPAIFGHSQKSQWDRLTLSADKFEIELQAKADPLGQGGPLCTTSWHQREPYNNFCPMGEEGTSVVGCVATAAAQVMAYYQWPPTGLGSHTYFWDGDQYCGGDYGGGWLTGDFSDEYDWANIVDSCTTGCTTDQQNALAELCYEVGVAFEMDYSSCGSGAYTGRAVLVYPQWFKYSPDILRVDRSNYSLGEWFDLVKNEIDSARVIQYRINSHSIVLDGYREQTQGNYEYHMNYGWANSFTAYYVFDSLYCGWVDGDICPAGEEYMMINIRPQDEPILSVGEHDLAEGDGNDNGRANAGETIELNVMVKNAGFDAANPTVSLTGMDPYLTPVTSTASCGPVVVWGGEVMTETPLSFTVAAECPDPYVAAVEVTASTDGGFSCIDTVLVFIGNTSGIETDFETADDTWRHKAITAYYTDQWHPETYRAHSGSSSWKLGGDGSANYVDALDAGLLSPPFLLPSVAAQLSFWHWRDVEDDATAWDGGIVMISVDGSAWEQITPFGGYPDVLVDNSSRALPGGTPCYSGSSDWTEAVFDLSAYSGVARIMFRFASDGAVSEEGWYIDDVTVTGLGCCTGMRGNVNSDGADEVNVTDLTALVAYLFSGGETPACFEEADIDASSAINVTDLTYLVGYLFQGGVAPAACP